MSVNGNKTKKIILHILYGLLLFAIPIVSTVTTIEIWKAAYSYKDVYCSALNQFLNEDYHIEAGDFSREYLHRSEDNVEEYFVFACPKCPETANGFALADETQKAAVVDAFQTIDGFPASLMPKEDADLFFISFLYENECGPNGSSARTIDGFAAYQLFSEGDASIRYRLYVVGTRSYHLM